VAFLVSTAWYAAFGTGLLEKAFWFYAANAFLVGGAVVFLFHVAARLRRLPRRRRPLAAAVFAAPGLLGAAIMLMLFKDIFPQWDPVSLGRYGAFILRRLHPARRRPAGGGGAGPVTSARRRSDYSRVARTVIRSRAP